MPQAPPPPNSFLCAPVGCRAISLVVCLRRLFHRSADPRMHMRTGGDNLLPLFLPPLSLSLSLLLSFSQTHARARAILCCDVTYLLRKGWCGTLLSLPLVKSYRAALQMKCFQCKLMDFNTAVQLSAARSCDYHA